MTRLQISLLLSFLLYSSIIFSQRDKYKGYWLRVVDTAKNEYGYIDLAGDTVIPFGKYNFCFTDTFRNYAIVANGSGFVAIDKHQNILYYVYPYDNGPDYPSEGVFRIIKNNKIGYAEEKSGKIVIKPQFDCAFPFENGIAEVGINCTTIHADGQHRYWKSDSWFYINKKGKKVKPPNSEK